MKSIAEILDLSSQFLENKQIPRSRRLAEDLLAHVLHCKRVDLYLQYDRPLVEKEIVLMRELVKRCSLQEPLDYVLGEMDFYGCKIRIDKRALIPRPETEILVDLISKKIGSNSGVLWDLCTGSGCIGIALKKKLPHLQVSLSDISDQALQLAKENSLLNEVKVDFCLGDLLTPFQEKKADWVVCNPPYISKNEYALLDVSVKEFEPSLALIGGERGVEFYERLEKELVSFLNHGASVFFEIGATQGDCIKEIFSSSIWRSQKVLQDWSGKDRFFFLEMQ
jgi:release factor glutamine methyltransferase